MLIFGSQSYQGVMMVLMIGTESVIAELSALSYLGIWVVSFLSNIVIPVPEEVVLLAIGYISGTNNLPLWILFPLVSSGLLVNDIIIYKLSYHGSGFVNRIYDRFFKHRVNKRGDSWMQKNVGAVVFISRFLVQFRFIGPFFAGQRKYPMRQFVLYDALAIGLYVPLYILLGRYFHHRIELILHDISILKNIILTIIGAIVAYGIFRFASKLLFKKTNTNTCE